MNLALAILGLLIVGSLIGLGVYYLITNVSLKQK